MILSAALIFATHVASAAMLLRAGIRLGGEIKAMFFFLFAAEMVNMVSETFHVYSSFCSGTYPPSINVVHTLYAGLILIAAIHANHFSKVLYTYKLSKRPDD